MDNVKIFKNIEEINNITLDVFSKINTCISRESFAEIIFPIEAKFLNLYKEVEKYVKSKKAQDSNFKIIYNKFNDLEILIAEIMKEFNYRSIISKVEYNSENKINIHLLFSKMINEEDFPKGLSINKVEGNSYLRFSPKNISKINKHILSIINAENILFKKKILDEKNTIIESLSFCIEVKDVRNIKLEHKKENIKQIDNVEDTILSIRKNMNEILAITYELESWLKEIESNFEVNRFNWFKNELNMRFYIMSESIKTTSLIKEFIDKKKIEEISNSIEESIYNIEVYLNKIWNRFCYGRIEKYNIDKLGKIDLTCVLGQKERDEKKEIDYKLKLSRMPIFNKNEHNFLFPYNNEFNIELLLNQIDSNFYDYKINRIDIAVVGGESAESRKEFIHKISFTLNSIKI